MCLILYLYKQFLRLGQNLPLSYPLLLGENVTLNSVRREIVSALTIVSYDKVREIVSALTIVSYDKVREIVSALTIGSMIKSVK